MRNTQSEAGQIEMNCDGGEKFINGEQAAGVGGDDELGSVNNASDNEASADEGERHRVPESEHDVNVEENLDEEDFDNGEFSALNSALDELQGALDNLESRNDGIHQELLQLLQSNREIRTNMMEENGRGVNHNGSHQDEAVAGSSRGIRCLANDLLSDLPSIAKLDLGGPIGTEAVETQNPRTNATAQSVLPDLIPSASASSAGACGRPN